MIIIYLIGVVIFIKLATSIYKGQSVNKEQISSASFGEAAVLDNTSSIEEPVEIPVEVPNSLDKNTWLYPTDNFGTLERGRT